MSGSAVQQWPIFARLGIVLAELLPLARVDAPSFARQEERRALVALTRFPRATPAGRGALTAVVQEAYIQGYRDALGR